MSCNTSMQIVKEMITVIKIITIGRCKIRIYCRSYINKLDYGTKAAVKIARKGERKTRNKKERKLININENESEIKKKNKTERKRIRNEDYEKESKKTLNEERKRIILIIPTVFVTVKS